MSAGRKAKSEKTLPTLQSHQLEAASGKNAASRTESPAKSVEPGSKTGFAQGTYYRQGVRVPGGPYKGGMPRGRGR
jgi:hypothetical protein